MPDLPPDCGPSPEFAKLYYREQELQRWLSRHGQSAARDQRHLEEGTEARAYWSLGYWMALKDVIGLFTRPEETERKEDC